MVRICFKIKLRMAFTILNIPKWVQDFDIPIRIEGEKNQKEWHNLIKQLRAILNNLLKN